MDGGQGESSALGKARGTTPAVADAAAVAGAASLIAGGLDFKSILAIADALPLMIAYVDRDLRYRFINRPIADFFDMSRSDVLGKSIAELMGPEAYAARRAHLEAALVGEPQVLVTPFNHPTRGPLTIRAHYTPHRLDDGTVAGIILVIQDVTEQKAADEALRESEARFRRIANSAPVPMWVTRLDRSRDFVNEAYVELMGTSEEEARHLDLMSRIHSDDRARLIEEAIAGEQSRQSFTTEGRFESRPGDYRWMRAVSQPRFDADGRLIGYIGVATDITVIREAEIELRRLVDERTAELRDSEQRFRAIFDMVLEIIVLMKPDGTIIDVNQRREAWRADDPKSSVGGKLWDAPTIVMHPQHIPFAKEAVRRAGKGESVQRELVMERDGHPGATLDVSVQPVRGPGGDIQYLILEARDITDLKQTQEQLRQAQKMEALGQLTGGIAHDFNNLLTVVVGGLDLIAKRVEEPRLLRYANSALSAAERGARLTAQLLAFSRVQRLEVRPTYVAPLIEEMRPLLRNVLGPGIQKKFDLDPHLMPVMADPTQLEVALLNLAINARDAMPDGGVLTIASRRMLIEDDAELDPGHYVELAISDTGNGMAPDVASRAFEPFFTTKDVGKGTGLGLSMVYGMARQSGGTARIESEENVGTTVRLLFVCAEGEAPSRIDAAGERAPDHSRADLSVLVIDDDDDVRQFIASSLEDYGYRVVEAEDGPSGIAAFAECRPDVVVLDFIMPGMSGAEVSERILADTKDQPILFVSGYSETDAIRSSAPDAMVLAKPFLPAALDEAVRKAAGVLTD